MKLKRTFQIPDSLNSFIETTLSNYDLTLSDSKKLAECVLKLSDFYMLNPTKTTPWNEVWAQVAYLVYFLPMNFLRVQAVLIEGQKGNFLKDVESVIDFGSGPGTASLAIDSFLKNGSSLKSSFYLIDSEPIPETFFKSLPQPVDMEEFKREQLGTESKHHKSNLKSASNQKSLLKSIVHRQSLQLDHTLFVASYSLTETQLPDFALECDTIMILEPSTQKDSQDLIKLRQHLIESGYTIIAPCVHQAKCPLQNLRDWCHDRIHVQHHQWQVNLEKYLPMKNKTITMSYLLAKKIQNADHDRSEAIYSETTIGRSESVASETVDQSVQEQNAASIQKTTSNETILARVIGDPLIEKGKNRQLICYNEERKFLTWLHRNKNYQEIDRGELIALDKSQIDFTSNELRIRK